MFIFVFFIYFFFQKIILLSPGFYSYFYFLQFDTQSICKPNRPGDDYDFLKNTKRNY